MNTTDVVATCSNGSLFLEALVILTLTVLATGAIFFLAAISPRERAFHTMPEDRK